MTPIPTETLAKIAANPTAFKSTGIRQAMAEELIATRERIAELEATILNEAGEGTGPSDGWVTVRYEDEDGVDWRHKAGFNVWRYNLQWAWGRKHCGGWKSDTPTTYPSAREAMRAADAARVTP